MKCQYFELMSDQARVRGNLTHRPGKALILLVFHKHTNKMDQKFQIKNLIFNLNFFCCFDFLRIVNISIKIFTFQKKIPVSLIFSYGQPQNTSPPNFDPASEH